MDIQAVKRSVRNLILTQYYEKPFHPEIGSGVRGALFGHAGSDSNGSRNQAKNTC